MNVQHITRHRRHNVNQLSDIFELSKWVANLMDIVGLKVCDEQEWKHLSNHYNQATGAVTEYNPIQDTTYSTNDFPMHEADRDELSKACMELDSACTTIKNLLEAVVNLHRKHCTPRTRKNC